MPARPPEILAAVPAFPRHFAGQEELLAAFRRAWERKHHNADRIDQLHRSVRVEGRHLALPLAEYEKLEGFGGRNDAFLRVATELGEQAVRAALERASLAPRDVDHLYFVSVTGIGAPSIDARLSNRLGLRPDVKRTPIFGLGCVAGAAGIARASDALRAFPSEIAVLLSVELCSLTLQLQDVSIPNLIATGLFGDGAAAVVLGGGERTRAGGPRVVATRSVFYPGTEDAMGWDVIDSGFRVVLSAKVPEIVRGRIREDVDAFLGAHGLSRDRIRHWLCHPGGPKVLEAFQSALDLPEGALDRTWRSLSRVGNLSSASVLAVLADMLDEGSAQEGDLGLLVAMGPGFCSELVLLAW